MSTITVPTTLRRGGLDELVGMLREQADVKYDVVVSADRLAFRNGLLVVKGGAARITDEGVEDADAVLHPTGIFDDAIAGRLDIPVKYLRRLRSSGVTWTPANEHGESYDIDLSLLDANVNAWLQAAAAEGKRFLVRGFRNDNPDDVGIARSIHSDRFSITRDNLDVILAALSGVQEAGIDPSGLRLAADLSERAMRVTVVSEQIRALAPVLLRNYRSPYSGKSGADLPVVYGGFAIGNSETGGGAFTLTPRIEVEICGNGMTKKVDALREVHLGGRLDEGVVRWSDDTQEKSLELVKARTRDAIKTFLDVDYVTTWIEQIEGVSQTPVENPVSVIERIGKVHGFNEGEQASILDAFIKGGDTTAGGVMQAVTAAAQRVEDPDRAAEYEDVAMDVLTTAAQAS